MLQAAEIAKTAATASLSPKPNLKPVPDDRFHEWKTDYQPQDREKVATNLDFLDHSE